MALTSAHIEAAAVDIIRTGLPNEQTRSTRYCLDLGGTHLPPKYVAGRAHAYERNGREWRADEHYGGVSGSNRVLRNLGFTVVECNDGPGGRPCRNRNLRSR